MASTSHNVPTSDPPASSTEMGSMSSESLRDVFEEGMKAYDMIEKCQEPGNSDAYQTLVLLAISRFEKATRMVSLAALFSRNEQLEELPTDSIRYLLLPALLGSLMLKRVGPARKQLIELAEVYFRDFLQRCKDYGATDIEIPPENPDVTPSQQLSEKDKIASMVRTREEKIKRYREGKELQKKMEELRNTHNEEQQREFWLTNLQHWINNALEEIASINQEKPLLEYVEKHQIKAPTKGPERKPLKPVIITRDAIQKAVYGAGYPALPTLTIEEFYDQRVREGTFPDANKIPHQRLDTSEAGAGSHDDDVAREQLEEADDPEELARLRARDEFKDDHRRGWGNRHNRS